MAFLDTPRLRLRPMETRDEAMFCHLYTDPDVMRRILPPLSAEAAAQSFRRACAHNAKDAPGHRFWAIDDRQSDSAIGMAALLRTGDSAELGVMLRNGWWNRGISSEAFAPLIEHAFVGMGLSLLYAQRPDDDHALLIDRLLDKFGFVRTPDKVADKTLCRWELPCQTWNPAAHPAEAGPAEHLMLVIPAKAGSASQQSKAGHPWTLLSPEYELPRRKEESMDSRLRGDDAFRPILQSPPGRVSSPESFGGWTDP